MNMEQPQAWIVFPSFFLNGLQQRSLYTDIPIQCRHFILCVDTEPLTWAYMHHHFDLVDHSQPTAVPLQRGRHQTKVRHGVAEEPRREGGDDGAAWASVPGAQPRGAGEKPADPREECVGPAGSTGVRESREVASLCTVYVAYPSIPYTLKFSRGFYFAKS